MTETSDERVFIEDRSDPFCYQNHAALDRIRECFAGQRRTCALGLYLTFTEVANRKGGHTARGGFNATRKEIAAHAGVGIATFDRYVREFEEAGLLEVVRKSVGPVNLPNQWRLVTVTPLAPLEGLPPLAGPGSPANDAPRARSSSEEERTLEETPPVVPLAGTDVAVVTHGGLELSYFGRPTTVARKRVTDDEFDLATLVLAAFCRETATKFSSADWIAKIVSRIREHPELVYADHEAIIRANAADPWWTGPANPSVIYGNGAQFERSMQKVWAPIAVGAQTVSPDDAATYGTEWGPGTGYDTPQDARRAAAALHVGEVVEDAEHWEVRDDG